MTSIIYDSPDLTIEWVPRNEWGASAATERFLADRYKQPKVTKTTLQVHHTAGADTSDNTPNRRTRASAYAYQRALQWIRPDLMPMPYSANPVMSEDATLVWLLEGCGFTTTGAHTAGHNTDGIGLGWHGNFDLLTPSADLERAARATEAIAYWLRHEQGFINLGAVKSPKGWEAWGHRDTAPKSCPGNRLYPLLASVGFVAPRPPPPKEDPMEYGTAVLEVHRVWNKAYGGWPTGTSTESYEERCRRLAHALVDGTLTAGGLYSALDKETTPQARKKRQDAIATKPLLPARAARI